MGQEINNYHFHKRDYKAFDERLKEETGLLSRWFEEDAFAVRRPTCGFELEAWLVDREGNAAPRNEAFLTRLNHEMVVPELARFNVELNGKPRTLEGPVLSEMHSEINDTIDACNRIAREMELELVFIGILPTLRESQLTLENISSRQRYRALNEQVLRMRKGRPLKMDIRGRRARWKTEQFDVMLESASTSLQIHLRVAPDNAVRYYNASKTLSAPLVAACANSPYLFGMDLWSETRIPLFEQSVAVHDESDGDYPDCKRVTFGCGYADGSIMNCFQENLDRYPTLLPIVFESPPEAMAHLRLHNGTIWRWNRPLIGFENETESGGAEGPWTPHLRVENRVVSAGPSLTDSVANMAFFFGLVHSLANEDVPPESLLKFDFARENFYAAARYGLDAEITWLEGKKTPLRELLLGELLERARDGLRDLRLDERDMDYYLGVMEKRVRSGQNGSSWQREFVRRNGLDMHLLVDEYRRRQKTDRPVHEWDF